MAQTDNRWPTWVVVVAVLILLPFIIWALTISLNLLAALSIGAILLIAAIIWAFVWAKRRVEQH